MSLFLREYALRYLQVKGHHDRTNFLSKISDPLHTHTRVYEGESGKASVVTCEYLGNLGEGYTGTLCSIFANFFMSKIISK